MLTRINALRAQEELPPLVFDNGAFKISTEVAKKTPKRTSAMGAKEKEEKTKDKEMRKNELKSSPKTTTGTEVEKVKGKANVEAAEEEEINVLDVSGPVSDQDGETVGDLLALIEEAMPRRSRRKERGGVVTEPEMGELPRGKKRARESQDSSPASGPTEMVPSVVKRRRRSPPLPELDPLVLSGPEEEKIEDLLNAIQVSSPRKYKSPKKRPTEEDLVGGPKSKRRREMLSPHKSPPPSASPIAPSQPDKAGDNPKMTNTFIRVPRHAPPFALPGPAPTNLDLPGTQHSPPSSLSNRGKGLRE